MIVTLQDHEIRDAIKAYVEKTIAIKDGNGITDIDFTAGRKDNGNSATITIEPMEEMKPVSAFKKKVNEDTSIVPSVGSKLEVQEEEQVVEETKQVTPSVKKTLFSSGIPSSVQQQNNVEPVEGIQESPSVENKPVKNLFNFNK